MLPANIQLLHLTHPTDDQIDALTRLLMLAFRSDPAVCAALAGTQEVEQVYYAFMQLQVLGLKHSGEIWVALQEEREVEIGANGVKVNGVNGVNGHAGNGVNGHAGDGVNGINGHGRKGKEGKIVGMAGWYPPGTMFMDTEEQREAAGLDRVMTMLPEKLRRWWTDYYLPASDAFPQRWLGPNAETDNYYLLALAVLPSHQQLGIGRALLYARGLPALREGKRVLWNAARGEVVLMYERWGARVRGAEVFESLAVGKAGQERGQDEKENGKGKGGEGRRGEVFGLWIMELMRPDEERTS